MIQACHISQARKENKPTADLLTTQYKLTEEVLNQTFTKAQVKEMMTLIKKDFVAIFMVIFNWKL